MELTSGPEYTLGERGRQILKKKYPQLFSKHHTVVAFDQFAWALFIVIHSTLLTPQGACVFTDRWRVDELVYGIPSDGPYQTNPPSIEDIISSIRINREGQVRRIRHEEEIDVLDYQILTHEIIPTLKPLEEIIHGKASFMLYEFLLDQYERKPIKGSWHESGRFFHSSSSDFDQPSSSHLKDDDDDGNDEGTSRASTPSPIRYVNSLTDQVPQVFQNPPNIDPHLEPFYTRQTKIINRQVQLQDEHRGRVRSIGKSLRRLWRKMKK
ncbi:hypothetical protein Tco_0801012 [Tanacetum coccineum]|uniref:Uncharacterized protein n=1 Tax=Tanacetum coccineum TaxID=301880 RepID=A0ABQ4ZUT1_9ASTR